MGLLILLIIILVGYYFLNHRVFKNNQEERRNYYRNVYLKSDAWQRKRYVVFKRDNWRCVYCGAPATQVHHLKYAKWNISQFTWIIFQPYGKLDKGAQYFTPQIRRKG